MNLYQNEIIEHAKKSDQNMRVALLAGLSFEKLRSSLIRDFANAMNLELQKSWDEIEMRGWLSESAASYSGVACRQNHWPKNIFVKVEPQRGGLCDFIIGIKAGKHLVDDSDRRAMAVQLDAVLAKGKCSDWWPWYRELDIRYRNFDREETLMALYKKEEMVRDIVGEVEKIGKIVDSVFSNNAL